jgi:hypothetical protein
MLWLCRFLIGSASRFGIHSIPVARGQQENTGATEVRGIRPSDKVAEAKSLHGASFTSVKHLRQHIDALIESYNPHAKPIASTKAKATKTASNHVSPIDDSGC